MTSILIVEDNATLRAYYKSILEAEGYSVQSTHSGAHALDVFGADAPEVVVTDLVLPDRDGIELMRDCLSLDPRVRFIFLTGHATLKIAVDAMRRGAVDFLSKPVAENDFIASVERALLLKRSNPETAPSFDRSREMGLPGLIGSSEIMRDIFHRVRLMAGSEVPVFIIGEEGTGQRSIATQIHTFSERVREKIIYFDANLEPTDRHVEYFLSYGQPTVFEQAHGGTLVLSAPESLSLEAQKALLASIKAGEREAYLATGSPRLIAISQAEPSVEVANGRLLKDLYNHLYVAPLRLPPLRERGEDIIAIALDALRRFRSRSSAQTPVVSVSPEAIERLRHYSWPGNVRELINTMKGISAQYEGPILLSHMLPDEILPAADIVAPSGLEAFVGQDLETIERRLIEMTIETAGGSVAKAAKILKVSPSTLYRKKESWEKKTQETS